MEANAQYALHDNEATPPAWAARVRLTPELLDKLRQAPERVLLKLNAAGGDGSKKTSEMTVKLATDAAGEDESEEHYELLSFPEDPGINHVCTFRREADGGGYNIFKTGAIHQKLLVQRLLDAMEKDRIKDKHAKSVIASKARSSKLIDSGVQKPSKRQRVVTRLSRPPTSTTGSAWSTAAGHKRSRKLTLPSALTEEAAKEAKEKIDKGFEVEVAEVPELRVNEPSLEDGKLEEEGGSPKVKGDAAAASFHDLFSSDSDDEDRGVARRRLVQKSGKKAAKQDGSSTSVAAMAKEPIESKAEDEPEDVDACDPDLEATAQAKNSVSTERDGEAMDIYALKPIKPSTSGGEVKRARVRSALVADRVQQARMPNLSFFPNVVVEICQRLANYRGRSVILDESDYASFVKMHDSFRQDWEMLDKVYSIEMVKTEGLHLQLEAASTDARRAQLETRIQASPSKKEGLLFVRDAMASIQKILHSLQTSVERFDLKAH